mmetsp:Transcript_87343/g.189170  ORF Transcript_87343/g.189170 Transcript_87343/m.189170 type:complete len:268 (-) Transcript_87343:2445-3248(-)
MFSAAASVTAPAPDMPLQTADLAPSLPMRPAFRALRISSALISTSPASRELTNASVSLGSVSAPFSVAVARSIALLPAWRAFKASSTTLDIGSCFNMSNALFIAVSPSLLRMSSVDLSAAVLLSASTSPIILETASKRALGSTLPNSKPALATALLRSSLAPRQSLTVSIFLAKSPAEGSRAFIASSAMESASKPDLPPWAAFVEATIALSLSIKPGLAESNAFLNAGSSMANASALAMVSLVNSPAEASIVSRYRKSLYEATNVSS